MTSPNNLEELLLTVQKPARYTGGEWNAVKKEWRPDRIKVLLAFPDVYEVGSSYLGIKILYGILSRRDDCLCERVFSPWPDFEKVLKTHDIKLFSLESRRPLKEFDIIGLSLAYELNYTNALNLLDLGGIPIKASDRTPEDPIVIAGGPSCYNPEPMAEFIDAFVIGDGEEVLPEIVETVKNSKLRTPNSELQTPGLRQALLRDLARIEGVYVPSLYTVNYNPDSTIKEFSAVEKDILPAINKRFVADLDKSFYPTDQIVPNIQIVHDRIALEIMRGCRHACRFCQAGTTYRPCRERSKDKIIELAKEAYSMTGYEEISLLSLSSGDHSRLREIIRQINCIFEGQAVSISVPSLRIKDVLGGIPALISHVKKSGLTFAPEAASECLRQSIRKDIDMAELFKAASESFRAGWQRVKLYFMIGIPTEKEEDVLKIIDLLYKISDLKKEVDGRPANVTASINAFVPKPHTPFEREAMEEMEVLSNKQLMLKRLVKSRRIELDFHKLEMSYLEAAISRGDRRTGGVIYAAWKSGARFDGWQDHFNFGVWMRAFQDNSLNPAFYATRKRPEDEVLPWHFIRLRSSTSDSA